MCQSHTGHLTGFWFLLNRPKGWILMYESRIRSTLHEDLLTFMIISCWILLRITDFSYKSCRKNQNTTSCSKFFSENLAVHEIILKKKVDPDMPQIKYNKAHALLRTCWIPKATDTLRICKTYWFSTMVTRTCLTVTLYLRCLPCACCVLCR